VVRGSYGYSILALNATPLPDPTALTSGLEISQVSKSPKYLGLPTWGFFQVCFPLALGKWLSSPVLLSGYWGRRVAMGPIVVFTPDPKLRDLSVLPRGRLTLHS
jgi:hypothetical protein